LTATRSCQLMLRREKVVHKLCSLWLKSIVSPVDARIISGITRPAGDDRTLKEPERRRSIWRKNGRCGYWWLSQFVCDRDCKLLSYRARLNLFWIILLGMIAIFLRNCLSIRLDTSFSWKAIGQIKRRIVVFVRSKSCVWLSWTNASLYIRNQSDFSMRIGLIISETQAKIIQSESWNCWMRLEHLVFTFPVRCGILVEMRWKLGFFTSIWNQGWFESGCYSKTHIRCVNLLQTSLYECALSIKHKETSTDAT
jgi:hypothetical protein